MAVVGLPVLGLPWLAGLALRFSARATASQASQEAAEEDAARAQRESEQAREIARLREEQARLARDVHDVVGHSLAVILAQAESAQYLADDDPDALKADDGDDRHLGARRPCRTCARCSRPPSSRGDQRAGGLDSLIEGVRASGHEVVSTEVGTPQPLPPELEVVAYRVLQEMLTNAIKHGRRDRPVRSSGTGRTALAGRPAHRGASTSMDGRLDDTRRCRSADLGGQGLDGMQRRLEAVGGRLDVRRREEPDGADLHRDRVGAGAGGRPVSDDIRVLLVDDQELFREGVRVIVDAQDGMAVVGAGRATAWRRCGSSTSSPPTWC